MANTSGLDLEKIDLTKHEAGTNNLDPNFAVFIAKCQNTKREYLIKYKKQIQENEFSSSLGFGTLVYRLVGAYQVNQEYHELSSEQQVDLKLSSENLQGFPFVHVVVINLVLRCVPAVRYYAQALKR